MEQTIPCISEASLTNVSA
jgi:hypothetical protein